MAKDIIMPALGMAQETGILLQWLKAEGDDIAQGEPLLEVETDKAAVEIEAPASGRLVNITAQPGDEVPVGQVIALILAPGEEAVQTSTISKTAKVSLAPKSAASVEPAIQSEVSASPLAARIAADYNLDLNRIQPISDRIRKEDVLTYLETHQDSEQMTLPYRLRPASPKARRLAGEHDLELATINGSGPDGAILAADVLTAAEASTKQPASALPPLPQHQTLPVSRMWQVMAQRLTESWNTVPHFYLTAEANAGRLISWRKELLQRLTQKITFTDLLVKLVAAALRRHPRLNARWENETIILNHNINIGLAVAVEEGLLVPVIHQADHLGVGDLASRRKDLVNRVQSGRITLNDMSEGTFTISNLGMFGVDAFNAIVNPPQAAILALGQIAERVVPVDSQPAVAPMITLTLSCDHRVVDGARGAEFLQTLVKFIEDPLAILD